MYRLFTAIDFPASIKKEVAAIGSGPHGARWVPEAQLHLTLRFIGPMDDTGFRAIALGFKTIRHDSFTLRLKGLGFFPPRGMPRVLWVGVEPEESLTQLRNAVEESLVRSGLEPESRGYTPHVTIARLKGTTKKQLDSFMASHSLFETDTFPVNEFHLYSSTLTPKGAVHTIQASYTLAEI